MKKVYNIGIIGLGYVGFPLACLFSQKYKVIGFDINLNRVADLNSGHDATGEVSDEKISMALKNGLSCTTDYTRLKDCNVYIVTVPTPVNHQNTPNLTPLKGASETVGKVLKKGDIVIYESTVYPGMTEDVCAPIIEKISGMKLNQDFYMGYSPERINPGDKIHTVENIKKITSGSTTEIASEIDELYNSVLMNGTFKASSIKVAEAAKIIENSQRDVNIAFINEIAMVMHAMNIDTQDVLEAAGTKWNFLPFKPGLVGGHCISVDPYYLIQKAKFHGVLPRIMSESRRVNDAMGSYVASRVVKCLNAKGILVNNAEILLLGFTFKENCPDIRNTKVVDVYSALRDFTDNVSIFDPWVDQYEAVQEYGIKVETQKQDIINKKYDAVVLCVNHEYFDKIDLLSLLKNPGIIFDVKGKLDRDIVTDRL